MENGGESKVGECVCLSSTPSGHVGVGEKEADSENSSGVRLTSVF